MPSVRGVNPAAATPLGQVPVGTVVAYVGALDVLPLQWQPCDGRQITDAQSPFNGQRTPDLMGRRFTMGVPADNEVNVQGGRNDIATDGAHDHGGVTGGGGNHSHTISVAQAGAHNHTASTGGADIQQPQGGQFQWNDGNQQHNHTHGVDVASNGTHGHDASASTDPGHTHGINGIGNHNHGGENRPAFVGVFFIMLIRAA